MRNLQIGSRGPLNLQMSSRGLYLNIGSNSVGSRGFIKSPLNPMFKDSLGSYLTLSALFLLAAIICHLNGFKKRMHQQKISQMENDQQIQDGLVFCASSLCNKIQMCIVWSGKPLPGR